MALIYVTNDRALNLDDALRFTNLPAHQAFRRITSGKSNVFEPDQLRRDILYRTKDFQEDDYILVCGSTLISAFVIATIVHHYKITNLKILAFDSRIRAYELVEYN